jgi:hypothetical protein
MATSCFTHFTMGRNMMYISRWIARGVALAVAAILVPTIVRPIVNPSTLAVNDQGFTMMPNVILMLTSLVLFVLAWGQLQYAYHLYSLHRLLQTVADSRLAFKFTVDQQTTAIVSFVNRQYRVEVVDRESLDVTIYIVSGSKIEARKLTGALSVVPANGPSDFHQLMFDEEPFSPDYRKEMQRLKDGLLLTLPDMRRFTP